MWKNTTSTAANQVSQSVRLPAFRSASVHTTYKCILYAELVEKAKVPIADNDDDHLLNRWLRMPEKAHSFWAYHYINSYAGANDRKNMCIRLHGSAFISNSYRNYSQTMWARALIRNDSWVIINRNKYHDVMVSRWAVCAATLIPQMTAHNVTKGLSSSRILRVRFRIYGTDFFY